MGECASRNIKAAGCRSTQEKKRTKKSLQYRADTPESTPQNLAHS
jgi:hypothetical protein